MLKSRRYSKKVRTTKKRRGGKCGCNTKNTTQKPAWSLFGGNDKKLML